MAKYQPGQSGNPSGRPRGKLPGAKLRASIEKRGDEIVQGVIDAALAGDMVAAKALLDRICPALKAQAAAITLPVSDSLAEQGNAIIEATMTGRLAPDIGTALITALSNQIKIVEMQDMAERLQRIEKLLEVRNENSTN